MAAVVLWVAILLQAFRLGPTWHWTSTSVPAPGREERKRLTMAIADHTVFVILASREASWSPGPFVRRTAPAVPGTTATFRWRPGRLYPHDEDRIISLPGLVIGRSGLTLHGTGSRTASHEWQLRLSIPVVFFVIVCLMLLRVAWASHRAQGRPATSTGFDVVERP